MRKRLWTRQNTLAISAVPFRRSSAVEQLTVNQFVVGSIPTAGAIQIKALANSRKVFVFFKPDIEPDRCTLNNVHYRYYKLDLTCTIRHAPARLRINVVSLILHAVT